ncbi:hypothetical protein ACHAQH_004430 [Verticillium albo-atrum]
MEYKMQHPQAPKVKPRLIIHGGAGNITHAYLPPKDWKVYRESLLTILAKTNTYMTTPLVTGSLPSALQTATHAVTLLENDPLYNSGHGAVFTRDGINELEASVMVSRGLKKRAVGISGVRRVRNPILLARAILEHGEDDLEVAGGAPDVPSAQGHGHLHGDELTTTLAGRYGLEIVEPEYFFTQKRWDEHVKALEREGREGGVAATWSEKGYLPQGTCGAVALDEDGVVCVATSTGGLTNKLSGRIGDTPTVGAGFWAGEWVDEDDGRGLETRMRGDLDQIGAGVSISEGLQRLLADCLPQPWTYEPLLIRGGGPTTTTRCFAGSGTGNGDSFLRVAALHSVAARAQWKKDSSAKALSAVAGPEGELQKSAGDRWGRTGEGQGGIIGIELAVTRGPQGEVLGSRSEILQDFNCAGMFRAWVDDDGENHAKVWRGDLAVAGGYRD